MASISGRRDKCMQGGIQQRDLSHAESALFTAMTVGTAAENPVVYGVNANAFVVKSGQLVETVINNCDTGGHPIHLHGHAAQLVTRAPSVYGYDGDTNKMSPVPMGRDTWIVAAAGYTVLRFIADNPGAWFLHCHIPQSCLTKIP